MNMGTSPVWEKRRPELSAVDETVCALAARKDAWATLPLEAKISLLVQVRRRLKAHATEWVQEVEKARQIPPSSPWHGEEWYELHTLATALWLYGVTLTKIADNAAPHPRRVWQRPDGRVIARVFPGNHFEWLLFNGITVDVWTQKGVHPESLNANTVLALSRPARAGKVALVLGAGNVNSLPPLDALHRLLLNNQVVILKLSPVNDYLAPLFEQIFAPFIEAGYLRILCGDDELGAYLVEHELVDEIHVTGSDRTYHAITRALAAHPGARPLKPISGELGGVTPLIVLPGRWSNADLRYQAEQVVTTKLYNNGFNCIGTQILVLHDAWPQREAFLDTVRHLMDTLPPCPIDYPGAAARRQHVLETYPAAQPLGNDRLRLLVDGLDPESTSELFCCEELFGPTLVEVALPGASPRHFLQNAVTFANEALSGTLGANLIAHPQTMKSLGPALDEAVDSLHYGAIGVNSWCGLIYRMVQAPWGAFHDDEGQGSASGQGMVHNVSLLDRPQKAVTRASFYPFPRSWLKGHAAFMPRLPWLIGNRTRQQTARRVARFALDPGYRHLPGIFVSALRG